MIPTFADIEAAALRLAGKAVLTPLLESPELNARLGGRLLVKAECLQRTGSFKFRGAYNRISQLTEEERRRGVVAYSSGNHAQGVAAAASALGVAAVIVMPADAPAVKIANTREMGGEVVLYDRWTESREAIAAAIAVERGATLVPPFDDPQIIAGQGTCGLELAAQAQAMGLLLDVAVVPASGGGLVAGVALALSHASPGTEVFSAEPEGFEDLARSLKAGARVANEMGEARSFCDALMASSPGEIPFALHRKLLGGGVAVPDADTAKAMAEAFSRFRLVVEPGGAVALAAALSGKVPVKGRTVAVICSGGNVDAGVFCRAIG
jgi:threonine dehydratase